MLAGLRARLATTSFRLFVSAVLNGSPLKIPTLYSIRLCLGAFYYFQDGGRHIALNREWGLVLSEPDVERIDRVVSDEQFVQLEFGHVGHEVEVQMLDRLDVSDDHCPVQIELVECPFMRHVVGVVLVSGLGIAAYAYLFRKETGKLAVLPVICYGAECVGGRRGTDACSGGQDQGEDGGLEVHGVAELIGVVCLL